MKKTLSMLAILSAVLVSCAKSEINEDNGNPPDEPVYEISISPDALTFGAAGGDQTITVTSSEDWYLDGESDWCDVSASYGSNGDKVTFTVDSYDNTKGARTATFTFNCGDKDIDLVVTQEAKVYSISVEPNELAFNVEEAEKEVTVTSSDDWHLGEVPEWIAVSEQQGENGAVITVSVEYNDEADVRSGDILFICGDKNAKVTVTQQADDSNIIQFKDPYFLEALLETYTVSSSDFNYYINYNVDVDKNNDGQISEKEAANVEALDMWEAQDQTGKKIRGIDELEYFTGLKYLSLEGVDMTSIALNSSSLEYLKVPTKCNSLDIEGCTALLYLDCSSCNFTSLNLISQSLTHLDCSSNARLASLNVKGCTALKYLDCNVSRVDLTSSLTALDVSGCSTLTSLKCFYNKLSSLDVSGCTALTELNCSSNQLTSLDVSKNTALTYLDCGSNQLTSLDVSKNTALTYLDCGSNQLTSLDVSKNTALTYLDCGYNQLTSLDLSDNTALLYCYENPSLTSLNVSSCTHLESLWCYSTGITSLDLGNCKKMSYFKGVEYFNYDGSWLIDYDTKCPLSVLKIYKYHTMESLAWEMTEQAYRGVIEYVE